MPTNKQTPDDRGLDPAGITAALLRAARRAHEIARETGTKVVVVVDGKAIEMDPDPEMFDGMDSIAAGRRADRLPRATARVRRKLGRESGVSGAPAA